MRGRYPHDSCLLGSLMVAIATMFNFVLEMSVYVTCNRMSAMQLQFLAMRGYAFDVM